ncbi:MAG: GGDEF domain-containing protein [Candidatus Moranbacteria bacterium]|nr:GGDEF domain-containing protein [Candidatus Moranbacteria bacterium]
MKSKFTFKEKIYHLKGKIRELNKELKNRDRKIKKLESEVNKDDLTRIYSRKRILEELSYLINLYDRNHLPFTSILFDIDDFKDVNVVGLVIGDKLLKHLSMLIKRYLRKTDKLGRLGGDEFLILLPGTKIANAKEFAERIRNKVESHTFNFKNSDKIKVTISGGLVQYNGEYKDPIELLRRADVGLRESKKNGKNQFNIFPED